MEDESNKILALIDFEIAFSGVLRQAFLDIVLREFSSIYPRVAFCYSVSAPLFVNSVIIHAHSGIQQGNPLGPLLFSLVLQSLLQYIKTDFHLNLAAILDDDTAFGNCQDILRALNYINEIGPSCVGLKLSNKTKLWFPFNLNPYISLPPYVSHIRDHGTPLLGAAISLSSEYMNSTYSKRYKWQQCIKAMAPLKDPQLEALLLRSCMGAPKMVYLLRCISPQTHLAVYWNYRRNTFSIFTFNHCWRWTEFR